MRQLESAEQKKIVQWWHLACRRYKLPEKILFAIPNGGRRDAITGARLKAEGVRAGVPDLFLAHPNSRGSCGLFLELKQGKGSDKGQLSEAQKECLFELNKQGYAVCVPYGFDEAKKYIEDYLEEEANV